MRIVKGILGIAGWLMLILTAAFFIGGLISYSQARGFGRSAVQTQGVVTKLVPMDEEDLKAVFAWQLGVVSLFIGLVLIVPARFIGKRRHEPTLAHST
jgi:hypothetical protein